MIATSWIALVLTIAVGFLLVTEYIPPDLTALLTAAILGVTGWVTPQEAFSGFSQTSLITIMSVYIMTAGLERTGVTTILARKLKQVAGENEMRLLLLVVFTGAALSLFMNNVAATAVLLPALVGISRENGSPTSKTLIPLTYAVTIGGMATIFTSSNILVSDALSKLGYASFGMKDFLALGALIVLTGALYLLTIGKRLLPDRKEDANERKTVTAEQLADVYSVKDGIGQFYIKPGSGFAGELVSSPVTNALDLNIFGVSRGGEVILSPDPHLRLFEGDVLLASGSPTDLMLNRYGLIKTTDPTWKGELSAGDIKLTEAVLSPRSDYNGKTLKELSFREQYGLNVLAIWRNNQLLRANLGKIPLHWGDALLMQGPLEKLQLLRRNPNLLLLDVSDNLQHTNIRQGLLAIGITLVALGLSTAQILPISVAIFGGACLMVLFGLLKMEDAYKAVSWRSLFIMAGFIPLGIFIESSGLGKQIGELIANIFQPFGNAAVAGTLFLLTTLAVQILGNVGTAVIFAPIAINAALRMNADPRAFAMAVALGTSMVFLLPNAHPSNMLVVGPGGYTTKDFLRVGWGMTLAVGLVILIGLPFFWKLW